MQRKVKLMTKKKISFEDSLEDTDYGLIISADGQLKGMFMPEQKEEVDYVPEKIVQILHQVYGICLLYTSPSPRDRG